MDRIDTATANMNNAWQAASQEMYQATQQAQQEGAAGGAGESADTDANGGTQGEDVTDVEYEEVDNNK